jgi:hypothetical protein
MPEAAQPERKGSLLWWALGLLAAGTAVLGLGAFAAWRVLMPQVEVIRTDSSLAVKTPVGDFKALREGDETTLPVYPGAELTDPGATIELESPSEDTVSITVAKYRSSDPLDKVDEWYKLQLGPDFEREGTGRMERKRIIYGAEVSADDVAYLFDREEVMKFVILRRKNLSTEIVLVRIGEPDAK